MWPFKNQKNDIVKIVEDPNKYIHSAGKVVRLKAGGKGQEMLINEINQDDYCKCVWLDYEGRPQEQWYHKDLLMIRPY